MIKVMVCDDVEEICAHFCAIVESQEDMTVICRAHSSKEAVKLALANQPDIVLMDIQMESETSGIAATREICDKLPDTKVIMLTIHNDSDMVVDAYLANAVDYIIKESGAEEICSAIRNAYSNKNYIGSLINETIKSSVNYSKKQVASLLYVINHISMLTPMELRILKHLCRGTKRSNIVELEFISENTLKLHIRHILHKLEFASCREMVKFLNDLKITEFLGALEPHKHNG